jgi:SMI1 / KNR4 family (SUKH-1)
MSITEAIELLKIYNGPLGLKLHNGAKEELISKVEAIYGITLPDDFKILYRFTDGFETDEDMFNMIPLEEIIETKDRHKGDPLYIAEYMIYCDMWSLEIDPNNADLYSISTVDFHIGKVVLTDSLGDFIARFLKDGVFETGGLYFWRDQIKAKLYGNTDPYKMKPSFWVYRECLKESLMTKEELLWQANWIIATEHEPHHFFIDLSTCHDVNELITVLTSMDLSDDIFQVRAFFYAIDTKIMVDKITIDHVVAILNHYARDERFTSLERNKMMKIIAEYDLLSNRMFKKKVKERIREEIKEFFNNYRYFHLDDCQSWEKINTNLVTKFESINN